MYGLDVGSRPVSNRGSLQRIRDWVASACLGYDNIQASCEFFLFGLSYDKIDQRKQPVDGLAQKYLPNDIEIKTLNNQCSSNKCRKFGNVGSGAVFSSVARSLRPCCKCSAPVSNLKVLRPRKSWRRTSVTFPVYGIELVVDRLWNAGHKVSSIEKMR
jgi:hypothetical protein